MFLSRPNPFLKFKIKDDATVKNKKKKKKKKKKNGFSELDTKYCSFSTIVYER